jgi:hypothetical protein
MADRGAIGKFNNWDFGAKSLKTAETLHITGLFTDWDFGGIQINDPTFKHTTQNFLDYKVIDPSMGLDLATASTIPLNGYICGHVYTDSSETVPIVGQVVLLIHRLTFQVIATVKTDSNGYYEFDFLLAGVSNYCVLAFDQNNVYNAMRYDMLMPGNK